MAWLTWKDANDMIPYEQENEDAEREKEEEENGKRETEDDYLFFRKFIYEQRTKSHRNPYLVRKQKRKKVEKTLKKTAKNFQKVAENSNECHCSLVFDPSGRLAYWWSLLVSVAFVYNLWTIAYR